MANRTSTIPAIWATAAPDVASPPVPGDTYAKSDLSSVEMEDGYPYKIIADSATTNELLKRVTTLLRLLEQYGVLPWCATTTYAAGGLATGSNGFVYYAVISSIDVDPVTDDGTHWIKTPGASTLTTTGQQKIFGGFIIKWGYVNNDSAADTIDVMFSPPFPSDMLNFSITPWSHGSTGPIYSLHDKLTGGVRIAKGGTATNFYFDWIAIGV